LENGHNDLLIQLPPENEMITYMFNLESEKKKYTVCGGKVKKNCQVTAFIGSRCISVTLPREYHVEGFFQ
jgi:hypothetical protein